MSKQAQNWKAEPCPCGHPACRSWIVRPVVMDQGAIYSEEDARLIAAAPDLAEALIEALNWIDNLEYWVSDKDPDLDVWHNALAKMRGETTP